MRDGVGQGGAEVEKGLLHKKLFDLEEEKEANQGEKAQSHSYFTAS